MKNTIAKASSSVDELSKRTELTEERSVNTHTDQNSEKEQVGPERRGERSPGTRGAPAEGLTHVLRVARRGGRRLGSAYAKRRRKFPQMWQEMQLTANTRQEKDQGNRHQDTSCQTCEN